MTLAKQSLLGWLCFGPLSSLCLAICFGCAYRLAANDPSKYPRLNAFGRYLSALYCLAQAVFSSAWLYIVVVECGFPIPNIRAPFETYAFLSVPAGIATGVIWLLNRAFEIYGKPKPGSKK